MYSEIELSERAYEEIINDANPRLLQADDITELDHFNKHAVRSDVLHQTSVATAYRVFFFDCTPGV